MVGKFQARKLLITTRLSTLYIGTAPDPEVPVAIKVFNLNPKHIGAHRNDPIKVIGGIVLLKRRG
ncbi:MAG: hypothetical protein OQJ97_05910 [Rhodospirillales bacterium]|nr:hypothetical protein [Rhodospirillales bacterium]